MKSGEDKSLIVAKFEDGEDLFESLGAIVEEYDIESGLVLTGIGMLRNFVLGYFDGEVYQKKEFKGACELVSLQGSITTEKETVIHLHASLADESNNVIGGHLFQAEVCMLNEIVLRKLDDLTLARKENPITGLKELDIL
ncbi:MAG: PPC domain-containing DNA-binding protein [Thermoplasmata archaeon]